MKEQGTNQGDQGITLGKVLNLVSPRGVTMFILNEKILTFMGL